MLDAVSNWLSHRSKHVGLLLASLRVHLRHRRHTERHSLVQLRHVHHCWLLLLLSVAWLGLLLNSELLLVELLLHLLDHLLLPKHLLKQELLLFRSPVLPAHWHHHGLMLLLGEAWWHCELLLLLLWLVCAGLLSCC